ncbi:MAG: ABC transporter ATP-binding protein [Spirochaetaceae bacterium]|nr:ABC transporter ATP-binding protein [Spirochaetaceae bacterium]
MKKKSHITWIWSIWRERKGLIAILFALTLLSSAVAVAYPYLSKLLIDMLQRLFESRAGAAEAKTEIDRFVLLVLAVGATGFVASLFPGVRGATNGVFEHLIRMRFFERVLGKDRAFFSAFRSGDIATRLTDDLYDFPKLSWFLCSGIFRAVESISKIVFCLAAMLFLNWKLTLLSLIPLPLMIAFFYVMQDRIYDTFQKNQEAISDINSQLEMSFSGLRIIKAYACERKYERFFSESLAKRFGTEMRVAKLGTVIDLIYMYIDYAAQIGIIFAGGYMAVKGDISIGTFYAFYNYLGMLIYPILDIPQLFVSGKRAFVNIDRLEEMDAFPRREAPAEEFRVARIESVEARALRFTYEGREEPALDGVGFNLERGERLAVIGPVGSGKTTLMKALAGILEPGSGELLVNGKPLAAAERESLAASLGYVPQEPLLFSGTIRENVAFGAKGDGRTMEDEAFREAVAAAQLSAEIASFSDGEATMLGQRGAAVSGGQKQRIAVARALAREPSLLLFDDITASLDATNEERLWRALDTNSRDVSCVVVSHRLSTLQYADKVLFLERGRVAAFGRHEELLRENAAYRAFIEEHLAIAAS